REARLARAARRADAAVFFAARVTRPGARPVDAEPLAALDDLALGRPLDRRVEADAAVRADVDRVRHRADKFGRAVGVGPVGRVLRVRAEVAPRRVAHCRGRLLLRPAGLIARVRTHLLD